jgi:hypothetical protein
VPSATSLTSALHGRHGVLRRTVRRHRRPLAAVLAGLAALIALTALRGAPDTASVPATGPSGIARIPVPGSVSVPVTLASSAIAAVLQVGDVIDLVGSAGDSAVPPEVVARGARVLELPLGGSALGGSSSAVILVSLPEADALRVVSSMRDGLTPVIRSR